MDRMIYPQGSLSRETVTAYCRFTFSGSAGITNFAGAGFTGCILSGSTYTLQLATAAPQLVGLSAQLATSPANVGQAASTYDIGFNGSQIAQLNSFFTGSAAQASSSGQSQTIDFTVQGAAGTPVVVPYQSGANVCFVQATFLNQNYSKG